MIASAAGVWAALSERSYGGIGESCVENMGSMIRQGSVRSTKKNVYVQKKLLFFHHRIHHKPP